MKNLEPRSVGQRIFGALALLLGIAFGAHEAYTLLRPLIPTLVVLAVLGAVFGLFFRGRR
jgi:hypothetical protein